MQYKNHISDYKDWQQQTHASEWMLFEKNIGTHLSIDETALSNDELYTVVTNKAAKGQKGALVAMIKSTQADKVIEVLLKINEKSRKQVQEVTLDMAASMNLIVKRCFPQADRVIDRFHVQQLATEAVQELRIKYRWQEMDLENEQMATAKKLQQPYTPQLLPNAYDLSQKLGSIYRYSACKEQAFKKLALWYNGVEASAIESFRTVSRTIETHYQGILNFFNNRSTNASAVSFNAKIKAFRASARGVRDVNFFLFRLAKIYA